jgi:hypothetical protein
MGPREQRQGAAAEPRAVAVAAPVAQAAPFPAEPAGSSTEAWEPAVPPAADTEAAGRSAGTVVPADTGTEQAAAAAVVAATAAAAAAAAASRLAAAAAPAGPGSGSRPCRLGCLLRETGG